MTLVLPYGPDQIGNTYSGGVRTSSSMPCVFDGEALDFESALMTDWNSEINVYESSTDDFSTKSPSDGAELKRKLSTTNSNSDAQLQLPHPKKQRTEDQEDLLSSPLQSGIVSSSSSSSSSCSSSSSSSSSSSDGQEDDASSTPDEEEYIPRRRGPQMWNSRQRWKDERKRVLKLSISKLAEIDDPEVYIHRSVVINNTIRRLHTDIKNERQAKLKQRQQRMDLFNERFEQRLGSFREEKSSVTIESFDDSSCDEMFGISEDFLRVTIPDRRAPTPIPQSVPHSLNCSEDQEDSRMDTSESQTTCFNSASSASSSCDKHNTSASPVRLSNAASATTTNNTTSIISSTATNNTNSCSSNSRRLVSNSGPQQCATQYRTSRDAGSGTSFPPRVPILDSVVYHSLLASLEH